VPDPSSGVHVIASHGQPLSFAQASRWTDPQNSTSLSGTPALLPARGKLGEATTAASYGRPTCAITAISAGSSRGSTSAARTSGSSSSSRSSSGDG